MSREALITVVALVVTAVWGLSGIFAILNRDPTVLGIVTGLFAIIVSGLMAAQVRNGKNGHAT